MSHLATLIPAYKADFLGPLLQGLQRQTWRDFQVIVADDSPGRRISALLRGGHFDAVTAGLHITVLRGAGSALRNHERVLQAWGGATPLVHLLMDDDVVEPTFYERHVALHDAHPGLAASVSLRRLIDAAGRPLGELPLPAFITGAADPCVLVDAPTLVRSTVAPCENWLGELSNIVLSADAARCFPLPPDDGVSYFGLPDIGTLLAAQHCGPVAVWREVLGGFRQHGGQTTANTQSRSLKVAHLAWVSFALKARQDGALDDEAVRQAVAVAIRRCLGVYAHDADLRPFFELARDGLTGDLDAFTRHFVRLWHALLDSNADTRRGDRNPFLAAAPVASQAPVATAPATGSAPKPAEAAMPTVPRPGAAALAAVPLPPPGLLILDDFFPELLTGFRVAEYNALMALSPQVQVASCVEQFAERHARYAALYPDLASRVRPFDTAQVPVPGTVAYLNFLNNALRFLPWIERHGLPFALTLYPGGGFGIGAPFSDNGLKRVLASPLLRHVIATQPITQLYLQDFAAAHGLPLPPCTLIAGGVASERYFAPDAPPHAPWFGEGKAVMDIAFVAEKYMPDGANKGWPAFVDALRTLADRPQLRWHVVGGFGPDDLPADEHALRERVRFHGRLTTAALQRLLCGVDVVVSLSRPGMLHAGNFDGFPTGSAVEASLTGAAIVASDVLLQNPGYVDGESMMLVEPEGADVSRALLALLAAPQRVGAVARAGQAFTRRHYALERQVTPRWQVLQALMHDGAPRAVAAQVAA